MFGGGCVFVFRKILSHLKSPRQDIRLKGMQALEKMRTSNKTLSVNQLTKMILSASYNYPSTNEGWDDPSYFLLKGVCKYDMPELCNLIRSNYEGFSPSAMIEALQFVCRYENQENARFFEKVYMSAIKNNEDLLIPINFFERSEWVCNLLDKMSKELRSDRYRDHYYHFLYFALGRKRGVDLINDETFGCLLNDYQDEKLRYLEYDSAYRPKHVYRSWKQEYLTIRHNMCLYLNLLSYFDTDEVKLLLKEATSFNDPIVAMKGTLGYFDLTGELTDVEFEKYLFHIESSLAFWQELSERGYHAKYNLMEHRHHSFAKTLLFYQLMKVEDSLCFPEDFKVEKVIDFKNHRNQAERAFLVSFVEEKEVYMGWAKGFLLDDKNHVYHIEGNAFSHFESYSEGAMNMYVNKFKREQSAGDV